MVFENFVDQKYYNKFSFTKKFSFLFRLPDKLFLCLEQNIHIVSNTFKIVRQN